ncbi:VOC family protein [Kribbella shirazensis]|jgi:PhnB protein|uniref:Putative glyoxalase superfamily protein PhnB n=1 Tax=Kribbella shirazensis TaxID=1105143 RepID=A0A7X5ZZT5_9ACTN|nr:VOC family protein [Kribbella shirazensis]NIK56045.1 putative glyoxalase superfamily protein PhnB [Kribbella shirazensis]
MTTQQIPGGKSTVTPYIAAKSADRFLEFVERTFEVRTTARVLNEDGTVGHAEITVGDSVLMTFDAAPDWPDTPSFLSVYVDDVERVYQRALDAGATVVTELMYSRIIGDRVGRVKDPVGNIWWLQTHVEDVDPGDLQDLFADPVEAAVIRKAQDTFAAEMRSRSTN